MQNNNEPIFIMNRKKSFFVSLYYIFVFIWDLATLLIGICFIDLDNFLANIIGFIIVAIIPYHFFCAIDIKTVICYEDFFIIKRKFCTQKVYYRKFKDYWFFTSITNNNIVVRFKKFKFPIHINQNMFTKDEIKNFIEILEKNNIKRYSWFD
ncbi:hypothetical protein [Campylobacter sp. RM12637]|uniref:hypothetical protein n=1 Tax=Campylobacter sp. RM12637 TaxID=2735734 RepID=UPI00301540BD|nr:hypothetical protein [Campylobacter sp. RM12637]